MSQNKQDQGTKGKSLIFADCVVDTELKQERPIYKTFTMPQGIQLPKEATMI